LLTAGGPGTTGPGKITFQLTGGVPGGTMYIAACPRAHLLPQPVAYPLPTFLLVSAFTAFRRYRVLIPVVVALALYQAMCFIMLHGSFGSSPEIPEMLDLRVLSIVLPMVVALGGSVWSFMATRVMRERVIGTIISTVGSGLTAGQAYFYITIIWGTI
jgi:hypothetical protein